MEQSILKSTKKILGVDPADDSFDLDVITAINTEFSTLTDMGVGPEAGFVIEDDTKEWAAFLPGEEDEIKLSKVKTAVFLRAKLLFDPPTTSFHLDAVKEQLREAEWRLNVNREDTEWTDPDPPTVLVVDGGDPAGE